MAQKPAWMETECMAINLLDLEHVPTPFIGAIRIPDVCMNIFHARMPDDDEVKEEEPVDMGDEEEVGEEIEE